jgi:uncharacterized damage-inducible protein DinB
MVDTDLRYPIGEFTLPGKLESGDRSRAIKKLAELPSMLRAAVKDLSDEQMDTPYRPDGWTLRQVVHHLPDSHMNSYTRLKLALTEDTPTVRTFDEALWAMLPDSAAPIDLSLGLLDRLHERWVFLWRSLSEREWHRRLRHPDLGEMKVDELLAFYAWHGRHHVAHITELRRRRGW